jgi:hypothetical protein
MPRPKAAKRSRKLCVKQNRARRRAKSLSRWLKKVPYKKASEKRPISMGGERVAYFIAAKERGRARKKFTDRSDIK